MIEEKVEKPEGKVPRPERQPKGPGTLPGPTGPQPVTAQVAIDLYRSIHTALQGSNPEWLLPTEVPPLT
jgi:hypothetical protein